MQRYNFLFKKAIYLSVVLTVFFFVFFLLFPKSFQIQNLPIEKWIKHKLLII